MTTRQFCKKFNACQEGEEWALATRQSMAKIWLRDDLRYEWRIWIATRPGVLDDRSLRLFACWSVRQIWHLLTDKRSRNAVEVAERFANDEATEDDLVAAWDAARDATWAAAGTSAKAAARAATWAAAWDAAGDAAKAAARAAAGASARDAAWDAARDAAWNAAWAVAIYAQSKWLIENTQPNF